MIKYYCDKCDKESTNRNDIKDYYVIIENGSFEQGLMLCEKCLNSLKKGIETTIHD